MRRRALRSYKCKEGFHQGAPPREVPVVLDDSGERFVNIERGCRWTGCRCYCHPWFKKRVTLEAWLIEAEARKVPRASV